MLLYCTLSFFSFPFPLHVVVFPLPPPQDLSAFRPNTVSTMLGISDVDATVRSASSSKRSLSLLRQIPVSPIEAQMSDVCHRPSTQLSLLYSIRLPLHEQRGWLWLSRARGFKPSACGTLIDCESWEGGIIPADVTESSLVPQLVSQLMSVMVPAGNSVIACFDSMQFVLHSGYPCRGGSRQPEK